MKHTVQVTITYLYEADTTAYQDPERPITSIEDGRERIAEYDATESLLLELAANTQDIRYGFEVDGVSYGVARD